jgi:ATP-dependent 26S proteasome regulatory subunit
MRSQPGVMLLAATNRPEALDPALVRGGRLSRTIELPLPDLAGRRRLLDRLTERMTLSGIDLDELAEDTDGYSPADLKALCQQAAIQSLMRDQDDPTITAADLGAALGAAKSRPAPRPPRKRTRPLRAGD